MQPGMRRLWIIFVMVRWRGVADASTTPPNMPRGAGWDTTTTSPNSYNNFEKNNFRIVDDDDYSQEYGSQIAQWKVATDASCPHADMIGVAETLQQAKQMCNDTPHCVAV